MVIPTSTPHATWGPEMQCCHHCGLKVRRPVWIECCIWDSIKHVGFWYIEEMPMHTQCSEAYNA